MRWGGGTGLEVTIQAGFENDLLASWRKIPEQKSLHLICGEDAGPWAYLLPTVFVSTVNTGHSCCAASVQAQPPVCGGVAFAKAKRNFHQQSDMVFYPCKMQSNVVQGWFLHTNTLPPAHVFFLAVLLWRIIPPALALQVRDFPASAQAARMDGVHSQAQKESKASLRKWGKKGLGAAATPCRWQWHPHLLPGGSFPGFALCGLESSLSLINNKLIILYCSNTSLFP